MNQYRRKVHISVIYCIVYLSVFLVGCGNKNIAFKAESEAESSFAEYSEKETLEEKSQDLTEQGEEALLDEPENCQIYVHVCGAVKIPGVYQFEGETRVFQAIEAAGGFTQEAYTDSINQALRVSDGDKVVVPTRDEWENGDYLSTYGESEQAAETADMQKADAADGLININTASVQELCELPGIGPAKAENIVAYREQYGAFAAIEDIMNITGIKDGLFQKVKDKIKV